MDRLVWLINTEHSRLQRQLRTTDLFVLCQGLRKSSECSRNRKTIIPRCVPNMVCLHTYIVSEESVFLVLQRAEGGLAVRSVVCAVCECW